MQHTPEPLLPACPEPITANPTGSAGAAMTAVRAVGWAC